MSEGSTVVECVNCGDVWSSRHRNDCPRCGRPEEVDWDAPVEPTEFEKRMCERRAKQDV